LTARPSRAGARSTFRARRALFGSRTTHRERDGMLRQGAPCQAASGETAKPQVSSRRPAGLVTTHPGRHRYIWYWYRSRHAWSGLRMESSVPHQPDTPSVPRETELR
jgi:hypothetical protein